MEVKYQSELRGAEDRIVREEEAGEAMRAEVKAKEDQIDSLTKSLKQVSTSTLYFMSPFQNRFQLVFIYFKTNKYTYINIFSLSITN